MESWRDGSGSKSIGCPTRRPGFDLQQEDARDGGSQPSLTLVPGDMMGLEWKLHDIHGAQKHKKAKHPHTLIQIKMKIGQMVGRLNVSN